MILKLGDNSTAVALWQGFLVKRGFDIRPDGAFGPKTQHATLLFQRDAGVKDDGIVGSGTIAAAKARGFEGFPGDQSPSEKPSTSTAKLILVSAGHTNNPNDDRGAAGNHYVEGILTTELRDKVAAEIRRIAPQHSVLEDGADGQNDPLRKAVVLARQANIAVEFHWNASSNPAATGIEVLSKPGKKQLAQRLARAIHDATGIKLRGNDGGWKADNSGQHHRLAFCEAGGLIVEVCFISNASDMEAYQDNLPAVVKNVAEVLATT